MTAKRNRSKSRGTGALKGLAYCALPFIMMGTCGRLVLEQVGCVEPQPRTVQAETELQIAARKDREFRAQNPLDIEFGDSPSGMLIVGLDAGSAWAKAGCRVGDQLISLNGTAVGSAWDVAEQVRKSSPSTFKILLRRNGMDVSTQVPVGWPADANQ